MDFQKVLGPKNSDDLKNDTKVTSDYYVFNIKKKTDSSTLLHNLTKHDYRKSISSPRDALKPAD
jgi:hypothetical protein